MLPLETFSVGESGLPRHHKTNVSLMSMAFDQCPVGGVGNMVFQFGRIYQQIQGFRHRKIVTDIGKSEKGQYIMVLVKKQGMSVEAQIGINKTSLLISSCLCVYYAIKGTDRHSPQGRGCHR